MKALLLPKPGSIDQLHLGDIAEPEPGPGQVKVRVRAVGLNPVDYKLAEWGGSSWTYPHVLGLDVAGIIDTVGRDVSIWKPGDEVFYHADLARFGGLAEFHVNVEAPLVRKPPGLTFEEAASLPCAGFTALIAVVVKPRYHQGWSILIQGGAGGVGGFAIQIAKASGLRVIATCSAGNVEYVQSLGADEVIDYNSENLSARVLELTGGHGVELCVDTLGSETATGALQYLRFGGHLICIAGFPNFAEVRPFSRAISIHEVALGAAYASNDPVAIRALSSFGRQLLAFIEKGKVRPLPIEVVTLEETSTALLRLRDRHVRGKLVTRLD